MGLPKSKRLCYRKEFLFVFSNGRRLKNTFFRVTICNTRTTDFPPRYGLSVSKRIGSSVKRNLLKRRIREILRQLSVKGGLDLVIHPLTTCSNASYIKIKNELTDIMLKLNALSSPCCEVNA